jgi:biopolymer transport protein ExbB/TolQ
MALTPSQRPTREWPLLLLTLALVGMICFPLWQGLSGDEAAFNPWANWTAERWGHLLIGPEQIACYVCFTWAGFILLSKYLEVRRQREAFDLPLLPTEEGARILREDARPLQRKIDQATNGRGPFILANMIRVSLAKFALCRSSQEVSETVRTQAEVEHGRLVTGMSTVQYLVWAIPALGFLGTVRGLAGSMTMAGHIDLDTQTFLDQATRHLGIAFDCTLVALSLSLLVMFLIHSVQRAEEALVIDCQQYSLEHLVNRIYEPETSAENGPSPAYGSRESVPPPVFVPRAERAPR